MKITKSYLKKIIVEEVSNIQEADPWSHEPGNRDRIETLPPHQGEIGPKPEGLISIAKRSKNPEKAMDILINILGNASINNTSDREVRQKFMSALESL